MIGIVGLFILTGPIAYFFQSIPIVYLWLPWIRLAQFAWEFSFQGRTGTFGLIFEGTMCALIIAIPSFVLGAVLTPLYNKYAVKR